MPPSPPIHLLVVDDHAIVREGIQQLVQRQWPDSQVSQAGDLAQAHAVLAARPDVTLVLLDVHLPHSEPLQALRDLRQRHPMLPVAMLWRCRRRPQRRGCSVVAPHTALARVAGTSSACRRRDAESSYDRWRRGPRH